MIKILLKEPKKLNKTAISPLSGFVSFDYNPEVVAIVQSLSSRVYIPESREWEVPMAHIAALCNKLAKYDCEIVGEMLETSTTSIKLPAGFTFKTVPFQHQLEGVEFGLIHETFLLADEQGLGKTKQLIDLAIMQKQLLGIKHCFIICGINGNKYNWVEEIKIHSSETSWILGTRYTTRTGKAFEGTAEDRLHDLNHLPKDFFIITNIETLRLMSVNRGTKKRKKMEYPIADKLAQLCVDNKIGMLAFDECQEARNPDSLQGEALLKTGAKLMVAMSGTPLMERPLDLYVVLRWLGYEDHSYYQFKQHYCIMGGFNNQDVMGYKNLAEIRELLSKMMLRRKKDEVLDLPPKIPKTEYVQMGAAQAAIYKEVLTALKKDVDKIRLSADPLAQLIRLRQATGYPGVISTKVTASAKMERLKQLVEECVANGNKCIIFSNWEKMTEAIRQELNVYKPAYITGGVKTTDRQSEMNRFQKDTNCSVIIGTIGAMGTGYTLNNASLVIFFDEPWNRAEKDQAEDRAHRIGTKGTVTVITLITKDTIDERIIEIVYKKGRMADMLVDGKIVDKNRMGILDYLLS